MKFKGYRTESNNFSVSNIPILATSSYTLKIPLLASNYSHGQMMVYLPDTIANSSYRRFSSFIMFTTNINDALARSDGLSTYMLYTYAFSDTWTKGYYYNNDSKLSGDYFAASGNTLRIESCEIAGSNIELTFKNIHTISSSFLTCNGRYIIYE